jgi:hypothetical protein
MMLMRCIGLSFLVLAMAGQAAFARQYSADAINMVLVDAQTKTPIHGALVIARWVAQTPEIIHSPLPAGNVQLLELVTGADGRIAFPAWGPVSYEGRGRLFDRDPEIYIFKRGYTTRVLANGQYSAPWNKDWRNRKPGERRTSLWDGETVLMEPEKEPVDPRLRTGSYDSFVGDVENMFFRAESTPCDWQKIPITISYLAHEREFQAARVADIGRHPASLIDTLNASDAVMVSRGCPSPKEWLRRNRL